MRSLAVLTALSTVLLSAGVAVSSLPAHAEPLSCQGEPVTVEGDSGTEGDDVMVVGPGLRSVSTGAGDDLVCIRVIADLRASFYLGTGHGDDTVHNESTDGTRYVSVSLGTGADTYVGSDASRENVNTGEDSWGGTSDTEKDVVDTRGGNDSVSTGSVTPGTPNHDVISTGSGDDGVDWAGVQVGDPLDLGVGDNRLTLRSGWTGAEVDIDARDGLVTAGAAPVLRWTGDVTDYSLEYTHLRTSFTGSGLDEDLTFWPSQADPKGPPSSVSHPGLRLETDMGGGDDELQLLDAAGGSWLGGAGRDRLGMPRCQVADVRLGTDYECEDESRARNLYSGSIDAWELLTAPGGNIRVVGTSAGETIRAYGRSALVDGRGGRDVLTSSSNRTGRVSRVPIVIKGGSGADRIRGGYSNERLLGGSGNDRIVGGPGEDRIAGGPGRDQAVGRGGTDRCSAEVRRSCER